MSSRPTSNPSGALAVGTTVLYTGKMTLNSVQLVPDGTNQASVTVYDNTAASGKVMVVLVAPATSVAVLSREFTNALKAEIGITVVVTGGTATALLSTGGA